MPFKPEGTKAPFVCVHGDNCNNFLPSTLDKDQPFLGFLHLGADGEKYEFSAVKELASYYIKQLLKYKAEGPFILGGHSFGGIVAYEMAVQLTKAGHKIPLLILSDSILIKRVPVFALKRGFRYRLKTQIKWYNCLLKLVTNKKLPVDLRNFYILNNYDRMADKYSPEKYSGNILLLKASKTDYGNQYLNWDKTAANIKVIELEGEHNEIINKPESIKAFTDAVNEELRKIK